MIKHQYTPWSVPTQSTERRSVVVVGGGIAGVSTSHALVKQGFDVTLIEREAAAGKQASGNPAGLMMPAIATDQSSFAEYFIQAYLYSLEHAQQLAKNHNFHFSRTGIIQLAFNERQQKRQRNWLQLEHIARLLEFVNVEQVLELSGLNFNCSGVYFKDAAWLAPALYVTAHLKDCEEKIKCIFDCQIGNLTYTDRDRQWHLYDSYGKKITTAEVVVFANATDAVKLLDNMQVSLPLSLRTVRGQISELEKNNSIASLKMPVCYDGYITPSINNKQWLGATFVDAAHAECLIQDRHQNIQQLKNVLPSFKCDQDTEHSICQDRAALRCIATDYLPVIGPIPDTKFYRQYYQRLIQDRRESRYPPACYLPGLFMNIAHGSRGMVSAPFAAELLAREISGQSLDISHRLREHLHPGRFLIRQLKKGK